MERIDEPKILINILIIFGNKVLKKYIPGIKGAEDIAQDLIMHTAEVEDILFE